MGEAGSLKETLAHHHRLWQGDLASHVCGLAPAVISSLARMVFLGPGQNPLGDAVSETR